MCIHVNVYECALVCKCVYFCVSLPPFPSCHSNNELLPALKLIPLGDVAVHRHNSVAWRGKEGLASKNVELWLRWHCDQTSLTKYYYSPKQNDTAMSVLFILLLLNTATIFGYNINLMTLLCFAKIRQLSHI